MKMLAVLLNPDAGAGRGLAIWKQLEPRLRIIATRVELRILTFVPYELRSMLSALQSLNPECIIVIGGDGTLSKVVHTIFQIRQSQPWHGQLAYYNAGTGGDFIRQFPKQSINRFLDHLVIQKAVCCDVGKIIFSDTIRYFINIASVGLSADIVYRADAERRFKWLGGTLFYFLQSVRAFFSYRASMITIQMDTLPPVELPILLLAICNGAYFGGNMHVAPQANCKDSQLDVVLVRSLGWLASMRLLLKMYRGRHLSAAGVSYYRGSNIYLGCAHNSVWIEADGDVIGQLPARFEMMPQALSLIL